MITYITHYTENKGNYIKHANTEQTQLSELFLKHTNSNSSVLRTLQIPRWLGAHLISSGSPFHRCGED